MLDVKFKLRPGHTGHSDAGRPDPEELTTREAKEMLAAARAAGVEDVIVSGGEPFLREDLLDILGHMARLGMTARIASNGSLITGALLDDLRRRARVKSFQVSLDTVDPGTYAAFHGTSGDGLARPMEAVRLIRDRGFHTTVSIRLTPTTIGDIGPLLDLAQDQDWATVAVH